MWHHEKGGKNWSVQYVLFQKKIFLMTEIRSFFMSYQNN